MSLYYWHAPAMQEGAFAGQSCLFRHCTQTDPWQNGAVVGQFVSLTQTTHRPPPLQNGVAVPAHWVLLRHCTHDDDVVLQ
jgi:hypothetical protein